MRNRPDRLLRGISEPGVAVISQATLARPTQDRASLSLARMSQSRWAGPPQVAASLRPELQGCLTRNGPNLLRSGHLNPELQGCLRRKTGRAKSGHGIWELRVARARRAKGPGQRSRGI
eukprot:2603020-Pyramimonas_sp.AAC.1